MRKLFLFVAVFVFCGLLVANETAQKEIIDLKIPTPRAPQLAWQNAELVAMYHYDLHIFDPAGEPHQRYNQTQNRLRKFPNADFFMPTNLDVEQWVKSAVDMGATAAILTSCHENGLRLWRSDHSQFSLKQIPFGKDNQRDIVGEFVVACRKYNLKPGLFYCQRWNSLLRVHGFRVIDGECKFTQAEYSQLIEKEIEELCTRYGELFMFWFDGGVITPEQGGPNILPIIEKHQPHAIFYHSDQRRDLRWAGNEHGTAHYPTTSNVDLSRRQTEKTTHKPTDFEFDGADFCPVLADVPLRSYQKPKEWFWEPNDEHLIMPPAEMLKCYEQSVGHNATLVIGLTPDNRGLLPDADVKWCVDFGKLLNAKYGTPVAKIDGAYAENKGTELTVNLAVGGFVDGISLHSGQLGYYLIDRIVFGEKTKFGERVRNYTLEARVNNEWKIIAEGQTIGHKRIEKFAPIWADGIRLRITNARGTPILSTLEIFNTEKKPIEKAKTPEVKPEPEIKPEPKVETKPEIKVEQKAEVKSVTPKAEVKPEPKPEIKATEKIAANIATKPATISPDSETAIIGDPYYLPYYEVTPMPKKKSAKPKTESKCFLKKLFKKK